MKWDTLSPSYLIFYPILQVLDPRPRLLVEIGADIALYGQRVQPFLRIDLSELMSIQRDVKVRGHVF